MSKFFINRPIVAMVIAIFFVIAGAVMVFRLPVAQFPEIVPPKIQTTATYTGADALTVEQSVATPIEEQVNGAKNMIYMQSINGDDGTMTLQVSFEVGTDVDLDQVQVQNRLSQATSSLPARGQQLRPHDAADGRNSAAGVRDHARRIGPGTRLSSPTTSRSISRTNSPAFPESARSRFSAHRTMRCGYGWRPISLAKLQLTVADIVKAISAQNVVNPAGTIGGEPAPPGQQTHLHRARAGPPDERRRIRQRHPARQS